MKIIAVEFLIELLIAKFKRVDNDLINTAGYEEHTYIHTASLTANQTQNIKISIILEK